MMSNAERNVVIFDLGGVLIDWNPRYLYRKLIEDEAEIEHFLIEVCSSEWNEKQDAGRSFADATASLLARHPEKAALIEAYFNRFDEMMSGAIAGSVEILAALRARGVLLYALTNWSAETFPLAERRFDFLQWFRGVLVSGQEKVIKPDPRIYRLLIERFRIDPARAVYVDDNPKNAAAARDHGIHGIHFTGPPALRRELETLGLL